MGKTQNHPLRAFMPSEEQELHRVAHATSERLDAVSRFPFSISYGNKKYEVNEDYVLNLRNMSI